MGARSSRPAAEADQAGPASPPRPPPYAIYPPEPPYPPHSYPHQHHTGPPLPLPPSYYPANNGQYYGGQYHPQYAPPPYPPRPYAHAPPPPPPVSNRPPPPPPLAPTRELAQTATIRNAVNLKKQTLAVTALPGDPTKLAISFTFDASAACAVTTFVAATEAAARGGRLATLCQPPPPAVLFPRGLGHKFPGPDAPGDVAGAHIVDLGLYGADPAGCGPLGSAAGDTYPLVIRLEVVTERGLKAGHSLEELAPGGEQKGWVQSQTTFAALRREDDGAWGVRVLKQKIWVEGISYELQEIYGLEQAGQGGAGGAGAAREGGGGPEGAGEEEGEERLCVICLVSARDTTVLPCRHMCMCHECAGELRKQSSKCPICRNHVESLLHIRIQAKPGAGQRGAAADAGVPAAALPQEVAG